MALHRLVRQYIVHQARPWRDSILAGVATFLGAYRTINPSVEQDVRLLPKFMSAMLFRKMAHNLGLYRKGARSWESCLSQWQRFFGFLDEVDAFQTVMSLTRKVISDGSSTETLRSGVVGDAIDGQERACGRTGQDDELGSR